MQTSQKYRTHFEYWEYRNHRQLQKYLVATLGLISVLLYLAYKGSQSLIGLLKVLFVYPQDLFNLREQAEQRRRELNSHPCLWLK